MSVAPFARVAIPLLIGLIAGYKIREDAGLDTETNNEPSLSESELKKRIRTEGLRIITSDTIPTEETDLAQYIATLYLGLYYVGRTNARLKNQTLDSIALKLGHLHQMHRPRRDKDIVAWYETVGVGSEHRLSELLTSCPLAQRFDTRYIAHALGEDDPTLEFGNLLEEAADHFRQEH